MLLLFLMSRCTCRFKHLCFFTRGDKRNKNKGKEMYTIMKKQYDDLGPIT